MFSHYFLLILFGLVASCNTYSVFERYEIKPEGMDRAAILMEQNNPSQAQEELLKLVSPAARVLLQTTDVGDSTADTATYVRELASSMGGVADNAAILSVYANAEASVQGVGTLPIIVELVRVDKEKKAAASLTLVGAAEDDAVVKFFPAMPGACSVAYIPVQKGLDKAIAIMLATGILRGFPPDEVESNLRGLRAMLTSADLLNQSIFSLVNFICPILKVDSDHDSEVTEAEANAMSDEDATKLYERMGAAIDAIQAMVDANPSEKNLKKALERTQKYKKMVDDMDAVLTLPQKVRGFLVSQTRRA